MKKTALVLLWFGGFGLLPIWLGVLAVIAMGREAVVASPWVIVLGIWASPVTLIIACITFAVFSAAKGDDRTRFKRALWVFGVQIALLALVIAAFAWRSASKKMHGEAEKQLVEAFVQQNPDVRAWAQGGEVDASVGMTSNPSRPTGYQVSVTRKLADGRTDVDHGIASVPVEVKRNGDRAEFFVRCVATQPEYRAAGSEWSEPDMCERVTKWRAENRGGIAR